jgi:predicted permease
MIQDLRFAVRLMVKDRWFTLVSVLALALGIGMNATVFTFVNAVLLRGLPYPDQERILHVTLRHAVTGEERLVSYPDFLDWQSRARSFSGMAAYRVGTLNLSDGGRPPERTAGAWITPNTFSLLGQPIYLGRDFRPDDQAPAADPVVIVSYDIWQNRYGGDLKILGRTIKVSEISCSVIGVLPQGVKFPQNADVWRPLVTDAPTQRRSTRTLSVFGRLAADATQTEAESELAAIAGALARDYPTTNADLGPIVVTFNDRFTGGAAKRLFLSLLGAVGFVLLIACANVANLLLSRSTRRAREIAVRVSLGATRTHIMRQMLIESVLMALVAGAAGLLIAFAGVGIFEQSISNVGRPFWVVFSIDAVVFGYLLLLCLATGLVFGLAPALHVSRTNVNDLLKENGRGNSHGRRAGLFRSGLVVGELILSLVLLTGAGLMVRSFLKLYSMDLGAETARLLTMRMELADRKYPGVEQRRNFYDLLLARIESIPGVAGAAVASTLPLGLGEQRELEIDGQPAAAPGRGPRVMTIFTSPQYFDVIGAPLRRGRRFLDSDGIDQPPVAIVNERFVSRFMANDDPLGQRIRLFTDRDAPASEWMTIVGVSPTVRQGGSQNIEPEAVVYLPFRRRASVFANILTRTNVDPASLTTEVRHAVQALDADQPVFNVQTMDEALAQSRWPYRVFSAMFAIFAIVGLGLAAVGIYAVTAYSVAQRTQEIGVRMALGARPEQVSWLILRQGLIQLAIGLPLGLAASYLVALLLGSLVVQIQPTDPVTFVWITAMIIVVTMLACLLPARRATRLDPSLALRNE